MSEQKLNKEQIKAAKAVFEFHPQADVVCVTRDGQVFLDNFEIDANRHAGGSEFVNKVTREQITGEVSELAAKIVPLNQEVVYEVKSGKLKKITEDIIIDVDPQWLSVVELKSALNDLKVEFKKTAKKTDLYKLLATVVQPVSSDEEE